MFNLIFIDGCFANDDKIADIVSKPERYINKSVTIHGKVTHSFILLSKGFFVISDGSGHLIVLPRVTFPKVCERVTVQGTIKQALIFGKATKVVLVESMYLTF